MAEKLTKKVLFNEINAVYLCFKPIKDGKYYYARIIFGLIFPMIILIWNSMYWYILDETNVIKNLRNDPFGLILRLIHSVCVDIGYIIRIIHLSFMQNYSKKYFNSDILSFINVFHMIFFWIGIIIVILFGAGFSIFIIGWLSDQTILPLTISIIYYTIAWYTFILYALSLYPLVLYGILTMKMIHSKLKQISFNEYDTKLPEYMTLYNQYRNYYNEWYQIYQYWFLITILPMLLSGIVLAFISITSDTDIGGVFGSPIATFIAITPFIILVCQHTRHYHNTIKEMEKIIINLNLYKNDCNSSTIISVLSFHQTLLTYKHNGHIFWFEISYLKITRIIVVFGLFRTFSIYLETFFL